MFASLALDLILPVAVSLELGEGGEVSRGEFGGQAHGDRFGEGTDDQRGYLESERHGESIGVVVGSET